MARNRHERQSDDKKWYEGRFLNAKDSEVTDAATISVRESLWPLFLVTILYFLWVSVLRQTQRLQ